MTQHKNSHNQKKLVQLKQWRETTPSRKSQGRFPQWVKDYVVAITPEVGIINLSEELSIGQRTILRWVKEADRALKKEVEQKPVNAYLGEEASRVLPANDATKLIAIAIKFEGTEINAEIDKDQLSQMLSILFS